MSSSKAMKDRLQHAEGWWNANRPRKIAMVDNPFIPRNANQALIYQEKPVHQKHYNNHNIELVNAETPFTSVNPTGMASNLPYLTMSNTNLYVTLSIQSTHHHVPDQLLKIDMEPRQ
ncbi:uncharacterized protein RHIMIDRAFT_241219 [Rhizopus microsporus ATCC 52813]|uniref:Uncharacterized protein n=1 Tax=Rhizopus microsporus ATCC 52813 TaxID=1340429 RepID=A0A2G4SJS0_RHIZD|nr:uncharacterized protein RHIMIDRAFT_241219 [Rhizopus microsporus ATCC 52813]PHZ09011.1 hypothetical protein RHIMIDRAFT_241219 [Rhizopus microsporus ATCC 52813]